VCAYVIKQYSLLSKHMIVHDPDKAFSSKNISHVLLLPLLTYFLT
jgi:hypothetical protein